jgi:RNA polymerase sigma-70 factor (ECF subfamily)
MRAIGQSESVEPTDAEVIAASLTHEARFGEVFERHFAAIDRYLARRIGAALADDLAAETFVVAFRSRARFDPAASSDARPWLYGIAANLLRRHWRTERRRLRAYARTGVDPILELDTDAIERRIDAAAFGPALAGALASLSVSDREILLLFAWAELGYDEIAEALGVPVGTVRSRLSRARARIRELLSPNGQVQLDGIPEGGRNG